ncbi:tetratricopeptide repeat protein [Amycolatopsis sp. lyj-112]|uniref:tetratricopeptide repeat protein n=1 Tax=Amycolatopsis sp. lyj-112 TaxID=2789288 RepID=UPI00397ABC7B
MRVGQSDIDRLEGVVAALRARDYREGGGSCRELLRVLQPYGAALRRGMMSEALERRLAGVVADLYNLMGWTEFDAGRPVRAERHFRRALELAEESGHDDLSANVHYRLGRVYLHHRSPAEALVQFGQGQRAARRAGTPLSQAILSANQAWAYALLGDVRQALDKISLAPEQFADASGDSVPSWSAFFTANDMAAMIGTVRTELARLVDVRHSRKAIPALTEAVDGYGADMARSRSLTMIWLAVDHALEGDLDRAAEVGLAAMEIADGIRSVRTRDRLRPLSESVRKRVPDINARDLLDRIATFRVSA